MVLSRAGCVYSSFLSRTVQERGPPVQRMLGGGRVFLLSRIDARKAAKNAKRPKCSWFFFANFATLLALGLVIVTTARRRGNWGQRPGLAAVVAHPFYRSRKENNVMPYVNSTYPLQELLLRWK